MGLDILTEIISDCSEFEKSIPSEGIVNRYPISTNKFQLIINSMKKPDSESQMGYDDLFTKQICVFIEEWLSITRKQKSKHEPFTLMIHGHPSSGKSTAMRQIFKHLSSQVQTNGKHLNVIPIFSEIQNSKTLSSSSESDIWIDVVGGAQSFVFRASDISNTMESFAKFAAEEGGFPILFVDTVDILAIKEDDGAGENWNRFLKEARALNINLVFTCRTTDWGKTFLPHLEHEVKSNVLDAPLPEILLSEINQVEGYSEDDFLQFSRVLQAFLPMLLRLDDNEVLKDEYWGRMNTWFKSHIESEGKQSKSAISILFDVLWDDWERECKKYSKLIVPSRVRLMFNEFIKSEFITHFDHNKSGRLFFSYLNLQEYIETQLQADISSETSFPTFFLRFLVDKKIIQKHNNLFEFSHHLFLTQTLLDAFDDNQKRRYETILQNYADRRLFGCVNAWQITDSKEKRHDLEIVTRFYPRARYPQAPEQREEQEDKLLRFFADEKRRVQLLKGFAGTGKSRYCLKFIDHQFKHSGNKDSKACYVSLNRDLVEDVKERWDVAVRYKSNEQGELQLISNTEDGSKQIKFYTVQDLIRRFLPNETFTSYQEFKRRYLQFSSQKRYRSGSSKRMSLDKAWLIIQDWLYDPVTGEKLRKNERQRPQNVRESEWRIVTDFVDDPVEKFRPLCYGAYRANKMILEKKINHAEAQFDVITIDEVQDLPVPAIAFLINLLKQNETYDLKKQLLLAGDEYQCINHSGFTWNQVIKNLNKFSAEMKIEKEGIWEHIFEKAGEGPSESLYVEGLKYTYRNPPMITRFNQDAFRTLTYSIDHDQIAVKYSKFDSLQPRNHTYKRSQIVFVHTENIENTLDLLSRQLNTAELRPWHKAPQLLYPYEIDSDQITDMKLLNFIKYSAEDVKGLETGAVCIIHPYEVNEHSLISEGQNKDFNASRFKAWLGSVPLAKKMMNNLRFRMNVLLTRTESRVFIIWPKEHNFKDYEEVKTVGSNIKTGFPKSFLDDDDRVEILHKTHDDLEDSSFFTKLYDGEKPKPLRSTFWEKQAMNALIKGDIPENKTRYWKMYLDNVTNPEDRNNLIHTARLFTGQTGDKRLDSMLSHHWSKAVQLDSVNDVENIKLKSEFFNIFDLIQDSKSYTDVWLPLVHQVEEHMSREKGVWDTPYLKDYMKNLGRYEMLLSGLKSTKIDLGLGGQVKEPGEMKVDFQLYSVWIDQIYALLFETILKDREYITGLFGERGLLAVANSVSFAVPIFESVKQLDDFEQFLLDYRAWFGKLQNSGGNENMLEMNSNIHLHFSSKIHDLEYLKDDIGDFKIPLLGRHLIPRKGYGVAMVKLDKFIESFLISNYINCGRSGIQMSGKELPTDLQSLRTQQIVEFWHFYGSQFDVWKVLMQFPEKDTTLNKNEKFTSLVLSTGLKYFRYRIPSVGKNTEPDRVTGNDFITFLVNFSHGFISDKLPERNINKLEFNKLLLSLLSMDVEVYSNNPIDVKEYRITIDNFLSNLDQPNPQLNVLGMLFENFATNINLINSILSYINEFINSRYNFVYHTNGFVDEIFILLKQIISQTRYKNPSDQQEELLWETCGSLFSFYLDSCKDYNPTDGEFDLDFLISAIDNYPIQSVRYITYGLLSKHDSVSSLSGKLLNFTQIGKIPITFFSTEERIKTMLEIINEVFTGTYFGEYDQLLREIKPILDQFIASQRSRYFARSDGDWLLEMLGQIKKPLELSDKYLTKGIVPETWHPFVLSAEETDRFSLQFNHKARNLRVKDVFSHRIDRLYNSLREVLATQRKLTQGERGLYDLMFGRLYLYQKPFNTITIETYMRSLKDLDDATSWVFNLVGGECRICGTPGSNTKCSDCVENHLYNGVGQEGWHDNPYEILAILYMIHVIDYNEQAALNNEREIEHNLLKVIEESIRATSRNTSYVESDESIFSNNQLPLGKRNNRAIKQFYEKLKRADSELIVRFNKIWFVEMLDKDKKISPIRLYKQFDGTIYLFDMLFSNSHLVRYDKMNVFVDVKPIQKVVKKEMENLWGTDVRLLDSYPRLPLDEVSDKRVQHYSSCFNRDDPPKKNQALGHISAQYEKEFARRHVLELGKLGFKHDLKSAFQDGYYYRNLNQLIEIFSDENQVYDKRFTRVILIQIIEDEIGRITDATRFEDSSDEGFDIHIDIQRTNKIIDKQILGRLYRIPKTIPNESSLIIDDHTEYGHALPVLADRKKWKHYILNQEKQNSQFRNAVSDWLRRHFTLKSDVQLSTLEQIYNLYMETEYEKIGQRKRTDFLNIEDRQNIALWPLASKQIQNPEYYVFYPIGIFNIVLNQEFVKAHLPGIEQIVWIDKQTAAKQCPQFEEGNRILILESGEWVVDDNEE